MAENLKTLEGELDELLFVDVVAQGDLVDRLASVRTRLAVVAELERRFRDLRKTTILELREAGWENEAIGELLGVSAQRVSQLAK